MWCVFGPGNPLICLPWLEVPYFRYVTVLPVPSVPMCGAAARAAWRPACLPHALALADHPFQQQESALLCAIHDFYMSLCSTIVSTQYLRRPPLPALELRFTPPSPCPLPRSPSAAPPAWRCWPAAAAAWPPCPPPSAHRRNATTSPRC